MKVAFTSTGETLDSALEPHFGRAPLFLVYDLDGDTFEVVDNQRSRQAASGAGVQAAETVIQHGARYVVTGQCGPRAFQVLTAAGVKVLTTDVATVSEALSRFRSGCLTSSPPAHAEGPAR